MDTKSKSIVYSLPAKILSSVIVLISIAFFVYYFMQIMKFDNAFMNSEYFATNGFQYKFNALSTDLARVHITLVDEDRIKESTMYEEVQKYNIYKLKTAKQNLEDSKSLVYVLKNEKTGEIITNLRESDPIEKILQFPTVVLLDYTGMYYPGESKMKEYGYYYGSHELTYYEGEQKEDWQMYVAISEVLMEEDEIFRNQQKEFLTFKEKQFLYFAGLMIAFLLVLMMVVFITLTAGKRGKSDSPQLIWFDYIPFEFQCFLTGTFFIPMIIIGNSGPGTVEKNSFLAALSAGFCFAMVGVLIQYLSIVRLVKMKRFLKHTFIYRATSTILRCLTELLVKRAFQSWVVFALVGYLLINLFLALLIVEAGIVALIVFTLFNYLIISKLKKHLIAIQQIMDVVHQWAMGQTERPLEMNVLPIGFQPLGGDLNSLQDGLKIALADALKGEKLKAELITNVTHDLKNPLTSIINYVDLLQNNDLSEEQKEQCLQVLDDKSKRLKVLIEQLVEASKVSSGNLPIHMEQVDVYQMMQQMLGEFNESLEQAELEIVMEQFVEPIFVNTDSKHLWRVFENLLSNVVKYSMPRTRVYIQYENTEKTVKVSIKNISADQLNIPVIELTERFVRGDQARTSEGSGLGLSIASNLVNLIDGKLILEIDGDLFKATVELKK